ncbi:MAG: arsenic transporter [Clostridia bacterium]|nr:arsenic transporter [Clostridia bacterium]
MQEFTLVSLIIFGVTYALMMIFQKARPYIAAASALVFVLIGVFGFFEGYSYSFGDALAEIDWNVLMMIAGTMGTVFLFIRSGMPKLMSDIIISKTKNICMTILALSVFAGLISAFIDNVATVLMIAPVALELCRKMDVSPVPAIICIAVSSNLQGAATLVGDTTSILLAKAAELDFADFFVCDGKPGMFWIVQAGAVAAMVILYFMFRKQKEPVSATERFKVEDKFPSFLLAGTILALIAVSFIPYKDAAAEGQFYKPEITNGLICMIFFIIGLVREMFRSGGLKIVKESLKEIDYYTLGLLAGLFVVIGGIERAGVIDLIGDTIAKLGGSGGRGSVFLVYTVIVWVSVLLSAFIDNIPYTATMLPVIAVLAQRLSAAGGTVIDPKLLYFGLLCGATLGGNLTPIGASANITGIGILRKNGYTVKTGTFMRFGVPFTLAAVGVGYILIWIFYS